MSGLGNRYTVCIPTQGRSCPSVGSRLKAIPAKSVGTRNYLDNIDPLTTVEVIENNFQQL